MKKYFALCLVSLLCFTAVFGNINISADTPAEMRAVWLWGSTVREMGKDGVTAVVEDLKQFGFTDIFLLVKGLSGVVGYPSAVALSTQKSDIDLLQKIVEEAHKNKIKVHAWYTINSDSAWIAENPKNGPVKDGKVSPLAPRYKKYVKDLIKEVVDKYDIDGVHLDYIRYTHAVYSFDKYTLEEAKKRKIDVDKVKDILNQTFYAPKDSSIVIKAYQNGDPTIVEWEKLRRDTIADFAREIGEIVKNARRPIIYSTALMPEGAYDPVFGDVYYAQNYKELGPIFDCVIPMAYWKDFAKPPRWVGSTVVKGTINAIENMPVYAGLQAYDVPGNKQIADAEKAAIENGSKGVVLFRYGSFSFASVQVTNSGDDKTLVTLELKNRDASHIDSIEIDFKGTGLNPTTVLQIPKGITTEVNKTIVSLTGGKILDRGQALNFSVEVEQDPAKSDSPKMPSIKFIRNRTSVPVYTVMK